MQDDIPPELLNEYVDSSRAMVEEMSKFLGNLDPSGLERFGKLAHNLKGTGGIYGMPIVSDIASRLDAVAEQIQKGRISITPQVVETFRLGVAALRQVFQQAPSGRITVARDHRFFGEIGKLFSG